MKKIFNKMQFKVLAMTLCALGFTFSFAFAFEGYWWVWFEEDLLHDMGPGEAGEVAESIGAVDDRVGGGHFGIAKHKVAVWRGKKMIF